MPHDFVLDLAIAPDGALARLADGINRPKKRLFGVLKTENEFVGYLREDEFEIWERQGHAVHGRGSARDIRGGTRLQLSFVIPTRTQALIALFFVLYLAVALTIAQGARDRSASDAILVVATGTAALALLFGVGARRQWTELCAFVMRVFDDVPRLPTRSARRERDRGAT